MKLSKGLTCSALLLLTSVNKCLAITSTENFICAEDDSSDCYPRLFEASKDWKVIREGQQIPTGLHVRMNIDTLEREAKLIDEDDASGKAVDVVAQPSQDENLISGVDVGSTQKRVSRAPPETVESFESAVQAITADVVDPAKLDEALDILIDLSHDIEFGVKLTQDKDIFKAFHNALTSSSSFNVKEKIYRIMGSSLRNNPEAIENLIRADPENLLTTLFHNLETTTSDVLQKRILGVIQALIQSHTINSRYFNVYKGDDYPNYGVSQLINSYSNLGPESKKRFLNILYDLNIIKQDNKRDLEDDPDREVSQYLQSALVQNSNISKSQYKTFFRNLSNLHSSNKSLKPSLEFMQWLAKEVTDRKNPDKERDIYSEEDKQFDKELLEARHLVFGNPNAMRKAWADEL